MITRTLPALTVSVALLVGASSLSCKRANSGGTGSPSPEAAAKEQVKKGMALFRKYCGGCHGDVGQGAEGGPILIGAEGLPVAVPASAKTRTMTFDNAKNVYDYVVANMPPEGAEPVETGDDDESTTPTFGEDTSVAEGKLAVDQYLAVMAFMLNANGYRRTEPVTEGNLSAVALSR